ncbi:hypothetical protein [Flavobacterium tegetincola]|uniref:hypothetical protein n=1 Tax=Flavobacterium tegetincola TaxID=150172 RepID=UPI000423964F|nr:hypothetical protein [Flavobacterium tegetincola]
MNTELKSIVSSISNWNDLKKDKQRFFETISKYTDFEVRVPKMSACQEQFHIYFGLKINEDTLKENVVMHVISDFNDQSETLLKLESIEDFIFTIDLKKRDGLSHPYEIEEAEAIKRATAWADEEILRKWIDEHTLFNAFLISKDDFLLNHNYTAHFGMKVENEDSTGYTPDLFIKNHSEADQTSYYDLARLCPPYGRIEKLGLYTLSVDTN